MDYADLLRHYKTPAGIASALSPSLSRQAVHRWKKSGKVPLDQQIVFEIESRGELVADLPAEVRRPIDRKAA